MPKTGIRSYTTKTTELRWLAYYHRDGKQVHNRGFRTARQAERWRSKALTMATPHGPSARARRPSIWQIGETIRDGITTYNPADLDPAAAEKGCVGGVRHGAPSCSLASPNR